MYIVIVGHSEFAIELGRLLVHENEHRVIFVVKNKEAAMKITEDTSANVVNADPTNTETLDSLELQKCDVFITATDSEKENILSAIYAKNAGAKKIFVCTGNPETDSVLNKLGFTAINSQHFAARSVELMISRPAVSELVNIGIGEFDMIEVPASETKLVGKEISDAKSEHFTALATYENGNYNFSKENKIKSEDTVILLVKAGKEKQAEKELGRAIKERLNFIGKRAKK
jgi:trk system potassium uptake protein TrkA